MSLDRKEKQLKARRMQQIGAAASVVDTIAVALKEMMIQMQQMMVKIIQDLPEDEAVEDTEVDTTEDISPEDHAGSSVVVSSVVGVGVVAEVEDKATMKVT